MIADTIARIRLVRRRRARYRGNAVGAMRSRTSFGMLMRSSAAWALSPLSIVTAVQRGPRSVRATPANTCTDWGYLVTDRDRDLQGRLAAAPHIEALRRAADEDRDRLEHKLSPSWESWARPVATLPPPPKACSGYRTSRHVIAAARRR